MSKPEAPEFNWQFLLPKYWLVWLGIGFMYLLTWLPHSVLMWLGKWFGRLMLKLVKGRSKVAKRNIELVYPDMPKEQQEELLKANFENTGRALFETIMGWFWPVWRIRKHAHFEGAEHIEKAQAEGKKVLILAFHFLCAEMAIHTFGLHFPAVAFYRKHNNPLMEWIQFRGRLRTNKAMVHKRDVKGLLKALSKGDPCIYLPDQDYGRKRSVFVPLFNVPDAATTTGTMIFAGMKNCTVIPIVPYRNDKTSKYCIKVLPPLDDFPSGDDVIDCTRINQTVEQVVAHAPEQYMWLHKRFKTRPSEDMPSYYN